MESLPPLDTPTYRDLMRDSYKHVQQIEKKYERLAFFVSFMKSVVYPLSLYVHIRSQNVLIVTF